MALYYLDIPRHTPNFGDLYFGLDMSKSDTLQRLEQH
jgi:hypothetical protein